MIKNTEVYSNDTHLLAEGIYKGLYYVAVTLGSHPCCYVCIPRGNAISIDTVDCHGGVTYSKNYLHCIELCDANLIDYDEGLWIGWDYAHWPDYMYYDISSAIKSGRHWASEELEQDCLRAIDSILEVNDVTKR